MPPEFRPPCSPPSGHEGPAESEGTSASQRVRGSALTPERDDTYIHHSRYIYLHCTLCYSQDTYIYIVL